MTNKTEIEIEKKFKYTEADKSVFTKGATLQGTKTFTDVYFDDKDFSLGKRNFWLRKRGDKFELKIPSKHFSTQMDIYEEITSEDEIKNALGFVSRKSLTDLLIDLGFQIFCECKTTRETYIKDDITLDLDLADFGNFTFSLGEAEILVENESEIEQAQQRIMSFMEESGISETKTEGKIYEFMKSNDPKRYKIYTEARNSIRDKALPQN